MTREYSGNSGNSDHGSDGGVGRHVGDHEGHQHDDEHERDEQQQADEHEQQESEDGERAPRREPTTPHKRAASSPVDDRRAAKRRIASPVVGDEAEAVLALASLGGRGVGGGVGVRAGYGGGGGGPRAAEGEPRWHDYDLGDWRREHHQRADAHGGGYERQRDDDDGFHRGHQQDRHPRQHSAHPEDHRGQEHSPQRDERRGHQHSPHREPRGHQHQPHHEERYDALRAGPPPLRRGDPHPPPARGDPQPHPPPSHRGVPRRVDAEALAPEGALHALLRGATSEPYTRRADPRLELARVLRAAPRPRVLDIACGRGDWVADVASAFPQADVFGIDVPGIRSVHAPPNSRFMSAELDTLIVEGRRLADGAFDVVHLRFAHAKVRDFPTLLHRAYRLLAPGGLLLLLDSAFVPAYPAPREESTHAVPSGIEAHCRALARSLAAAGAHPFPPAAAGALLDELPDVAGGFEADYDVALCAAHRRALLARVAANRHYLRWGGYSGAEVHVLEEAYAAALSRPGLSVRYTALGVRKCLRGEEPKAVWGPRVQAAVAERERERERERAAERARRGGADEQRRRLGRQATAAAGAASGSRSIAALLN